MKIYLALTLALPMACGGSQAPTETEAVQEQEEVSAETESATTVAASTTYFYGDVHTFAPDGTTAYGPPSKSLVKRIVSPDDFTIVEEIWLGGEHIITEMVRVQGTANFRASDKGRSFSGELSFTGEEWHWKSWTYDIAMSDGSGTITGEGVLDERGITTEKQFRSPDGVVRAVVKEKLGRISEAEFSQYKAK